MFYAFQDYENLFLVTDLVTGGDLRYHHNKRKKFTEEQKQKITEVFQLFNADGSGSIQSKRVKGGCVCIEVRAEYGGNPEDDPWRE